MTIYSNFANDLPFQFSGGTSLGAKNDLTVEKDRLIIYKCIIYNSYISTYHISPYII